MKKNYSIIIFLILVGLNVFLIINTYSNNQKIANLEYSKTLYADKSKIVKADLAKLQECVALAIKSTSKNKQVDLDPSLNKHRKYLVIRLHSNDCNDCVNNSVKILEKHKAKLINYEILICANFPNVAAYRTVFSTIPYPVLIKDELSSDLPGISSPYIFTYEPRSQKMEDIFFPNWKFMELFETYIKSL